MGGNFKYWRSHYLDRCVRIPYSAHIATNTNMRRQLPSSTLPRMVLHRSQKGKIDTTKHEAYPASDVIPSCIFSIFCNVFFHDFCFLLSLLHFFHHIL